MASWNDLAPKEKPEPTANEMDRLCAQVFSTGAGHDLLQKLRILYIDKVLPSTADHRALGDLNAQRQLVRRLEDATERGNKALAKRKPS